MIPLQNSVVCLMGITPAAWWKSLRRMQYVSLNATSSSLRPLPYIKRKSHFDVVIGLGIHRLIRLRDWRSYATMSSRVNEMRNEMQMSMEVAFGLRFQEHGNGSGI